MDKTRRFVIPLAVISLVIVFLAASPFLFRQLNLASQVGAKPKNIVGNSRSEEANSRVYTSKVFNYSVTLPNEKWRIVRPEQLINGGNVDLDLVYTDGIAYIAIATEITDYTPNGLRNFYVLGEKYVNQGFEIRSEREIGVDGLPAIELTYSLTDSKGIMTLHTVTFLKYGNCGYGIIGSATPDIFDEIRKDYSKLVESFTIPDKRRVNLTDPRVEKGVAEIGPVRDVVSLVKRYGRSVVTIHTYNEQGEEQSVGSGFIVSPRGFIVTNYHVLADARKIRVESSTGRVFEDVELIHLDKERDFGVIKIPTARAPYPSVKLGDSATVQIGERVVVVGNPLGLLENTVSDGLVSGLRQGVIQISAPVSPGNSGGPAFNSKGEVIGITTASLTSGQNLNFCIPIDWVKPFASPASYFAKNYDELREVVALKTLDDVKTLVNAVVEYVDGLDKQQDYVQGRDMYYKAATKILEAIKNRTTQETGLEQAGLILERGFRNAEPLSSEQEKVRVFRNAFTDILNLDITTRTPGTPPPPRTALPSDSPQLTIRGVVFDVEDYSASSFIIKVRDSNGFQTPILASRDRFSPQGFLLSRGKEIEATYLFDVNTAERHLIDARFLN